MKLSVSSSPQLWDLPVYYVNHPAEQVLTLGCPGAQANMAVAWDAESKPIYRSAHLAGGGATSPRLYLDAGHHLVFNPAEVQDSGQNCGLLPTHADEDQQQQRRFPCSPSSGRGSMFPWGL